MINKTWKILLSGLLAICLVMLLSIDDRAIALQSTPGGSPIAPAPYIAIPDYFGQKITIYGPPSLSPLNPKSNIFSILTPNCNPNSVIYNDKFYVACNRDLGNNDYIGIYESIISKLKPTSTIIPFDRTIRSSQFDSIIAIAFDPEDNLWVSSYNNSQIVRVPKTSLATTNPTPDKTLIESPINPVGITFDSNGSLWAAGQYQGGIVINIPKTELDQPGTIDGGIAKINANPSYCISNSAPNCQQKANLFDNPEGIAIFRKDIWVSNNGGDHPAASLIRLRPAQNQSDRFGNVIGNPFSCPGGLKSARDSLWVNDQSAPLTNTTCGAAEPDRASGVGKVLIYSSPDLTSPENLNLKPPEISNITSRPGFGGIDVF